MNEARKSLRQEIVRSQRKCWETLCKQIDQDIRRIQVRFQEVQGYRAAVRQTDGGSEGFVSKSAACELISDSEHNGSSSGNEGRVWESGQETKAWRAPDPDGIPPNIANAEIGNPIYQSG